MNYPNTIQRGKHAGKAPAGWLDTTAGPLDTETAAGPKDAHVVGSAVLGAALIFDEDQGITLTITRDADDHQELGGLNVEQARRLIASMQALLDDPAVASKSVASKSEASEQVI